MNSLSLSACHIVQTHTYTHIDHIHANECILLHTTPLRISEPQRQHVKKVHPHIHLQSKSLRVSEVSGSAEFANHSQFSVNCRERHYICITINVDERRTSHTNNAANR